MKQLLIVLLCTYAAAAWSADTAEVRRLVEQGAHEEAYALAKTLERQEAGDPEFDFYFGLAAVNSGKPDEAVFAFERVVLLEPKNYRAHLELGRAYFLAGNLDRARERFEFVDSINPPPLVQARIQGFLDAVERRKRQLGKTLTAYVGVALGNDDNLAAASKEEFEFFGTGSVRLPTDTESLFSEWEAGVDGQWPFDKRSAAFAKLSLRQRSTWHNHEYDMDVLGASGGWSYKTEKDRFRIPAQFQLVYLGDVRNRAFAALGGEWTRFYDGGHESTLFTQMGRADYRDEDLDHDSNIYLVGGSWMSPVGGGGLRMGGGVLLGKEQVDEGALEHLGKRYYNLRVFSQLPIRRQHTVYGVIRYQASDYADEDVVYGETRKDSLLGVDIGWQWRLHKDWLVRTEYTWTRNNSNLDPYEYQRNQFLVGIRYNLNIL